MRFAISGILLLIFISYAYEVLPIGLLSQLENIAYDMRVRLTMPGTVDPRVVIVDIDEQSLAVEGQFPWRRDRLALLVDNLFAQYHVKVVGFDIVFAESDSHTEVARTLFEELTAQQSGAPPDAALPAAQDNVQAVTETPAPVLPSQYDYDGIFADSLRNRPVVLAYIFKQSGQGTVETIGVLPPPLEVNPLQLHFIEPAGYTANIERLQDAAATAGFFDNPTLSPDGVFRRVPLLQEYNGKLYSSLALAIYRAAQGWPSIGFRFFSEDPADWNNLDLEWVLVGDTRIPVDEEVAVYVPYRGPMYSFPYVSAADVIAGTAPADVLRDAIVLVGTSAPGLLDLRVTPVGEKYAGVEVHANLVSGLLDGRIKYHPEYVRGIHIDILLLFGILLTWLYMRRQIVTSTLLTIVALLLVIGGNLALWQYGNFVVPLASPLIFIVLLFGAHMVYGFFIESRGKRQLSHLFGQYIPPELVEEMARDPGDFTLAGESREMSVLFSDVRDFTHMSEGLSPTDLTRLMNEYLTVMTRIIHEQRGTIDKYIGDAIMAFWGAPLADADHAQHAVQAALEMERAAEKLRADFKNRGWPALHIGVGVNTGPMNVGNMGSEFRMAYTVMGDAVNLGSRLEGLTKEYGVPVLVSDTTREQAPDMQFLELDRVRVKGKDKPVAIFVPLGPRATLPADVKATLARHKQALQYYRAQQWDSAEREFFALQQLGHHKAVYELYLARIQRLRQQPPAAGWDGVTVFTTK